MILSKKHIKYESKKGKKMKSKILNMLFLIIATTNIATSMEYRPDDIQGAGEETKKRVRPQSFYNQEMEKPNYNRPKPDFSCFHPDKTSVHHTSADSLPKDNDQVDQAEGAFSLSRLLLEISINPIDQFSLEKRYQDWAIDFKRDHPEVRTLYIANLSGYQIDYLNKAIEGQGLIVKRKAPAAPKSKRPIMQFKKYLL